MNGPVGSVSGQDTHDRGQLRVGGDATMHDYLQRWRALLAGPPEVETFRVASVRD
jgi:hypothetical protein